jgi:hypothetical protein
MFLPKLVLDVRPEFFEHISRYIEADLYTQLRNGVRGGAIVRIVCIRNSNSRRVSEKFGIIELYLTGITVCPEGLAHGIAKTRPACAGSAAKVSPVLMKRLG